MRNPSGLLDKPILLPGGIPEKIDLNESNGIAKVKRGSSESNRKSVQRKGRIWISEALIFIQNHAKALLPVIILILVFKNEYLLSNGYLRFDITLFVLMLHY